MIFEPSLTGHRPVYIQALLTHLAELGHHDVVVVLPRDGRTTKEFASALEPLSHLAQYEFTIPKIEREGPQRLRHLRALVRSVRKNSPSLVIIPTADYLAQWCVCLWCLVWSPQFWSTRLHVNMIALPFGYPVKSIRDVIKRLAYGVLLAAAPIRRTATIDETNLQASWPIVSIVTRLKYAPEPISIPKTQSRQVERQRLGLPADKRLVGIVGIVDARKSPKLLLAAASQQEWPQDMCVLLAGPLDAEVGSLIEESKCAGRVLVRNNYLDDLEVMRYIKCLDWIWLVYDRHQGPSATLLKAFALGTMAIAQNEGWIAQHAGKTPLAVILQNRTPKAVAEILQKHTLLGQKQASGNHFIVQHSGKQFCEALIGL
jgi:hypothetical protein